MSTKLSGMGPTVMASTRQCAEVSGRRAMVQLEAPRYDLEQVMSNKNGLCCLDNCFLSLEDGALVLALALALAFRSFVIHLETDGDRLVPACDCTKTCVSAHCHWHVTRNRMNRKVASVLAHSLKGQLLRAPSLPLHLLRRPARLRFCYVIWCRKLEGLVTM